MRRFLYELTEVLKVLYYLIRYRQYKFIDADVESRRQHIVKIMKGEK